MVYSSGTPELEDAIPLLERWYDEKLQNSKKLGEIEQQNTETSSFAEKIRKIEIKKKKLSFFLQEMKKMRKFLNLK